VVVIPLSTASPPRFPLYVPLPSLLPGAQAVVDQIFAVDKDRILDLVAIATEAEMQQVAQAMKLLFELDA
jgi:mRNA-degrading endonuclease toxin of MazEF toxin-antitoxin module